MKFLVALALAIAGPALAADDVQQNLDAKAEACITAGAPEVARIEPNLSSAVDFLTNDLCAREIEVAQKFRTNRSLLDMMIETQRSTVETARTSANDAPAMIAAQRPTDASVRPVRPVAPSMPPNPMGDFNKKTLATQEEKLAKVEAARVDPQTGELVGVPKDASGGWAMVQTFLAPFTSSRLTQAPAALRAFAARAILGARETTR
ncbi:MAG TPA: hypothetical protein VGG68_06665 [Caulobacteraceae bacterium]|jgi:hypothetical protein